MNKNDVNYISVYIYSGYGSKMVPTYKLLLFSALRTLEYPFYTQVDTKSPGNLII